MSYSVGNSKERGRDVSSGSTSGAVHCCSTASSKLKLYQTFIFSVPILFTFILLFFFYWFYLRRRRADWSSLRMRANNSVLIGDDLSRCELGLKKELREMLPIIVFKESFSVKDTQCSVCLGEYEGEDRLQQIPVCGHTFHMECIDLWLTTHTTCPLCRQSLLSSSSSSSAKPPPDDHDHAHVQHNDDVEMRNEEEDEEEDPQISESTSESDDEAAVGRGDQDTRPSGEAVGRDVETRVK